MPAVLPTQPEYPRAVPADLPFRETSPVSTTGRRSPTPLPHDHVGDGLRSHDYHDTVTGMTICIQQLHNTHFQEAIVPIQG